MKENKTGWKQATGYKESIKSKVSPWQGSSEGLVSLVKMTSILLLSGYVSTACLPILFQVCLVICTYTFVKGPVQTEYENKPHLLDAIN